MRAAGFKVGNDKTLFWRRLFFVTSIPVHVDSHAGHRRSRRRSRNAPAGSPWRDIRGEGSPHQALQQQDVVNSST
jgi:hypothetical protein